MVKLKKSALKRIIAIVITVIFIFIAASMLSTKLVYDGIFARYDCAATSKADTFASREELEYASGENKLYGCLFRPENAEADTLVVIVPGLGACSESYMAQAESFVENGRAVFLFDPTGCCSSEGASAVGFSQELIDLEATLKYIEKNNRFGYNNIVLFGHSRGGYAACCALSLDFDLSAVISVSGINSPMDCVIGSATQYVGPLAYGNYGFLWLYQAMLFGADRVGLSADEVLSNSDLPALIIHGANDTTVPAEKFSIISHREQIENEKVEYLICDTPSADGHTNLLFGADGSANQTLMNEINLFLDKTLN